MTTTTKNRRRQRRYNVTREQSACVEFEHPMPHGKHYRLSVCNFSASGLSFLIGEDDEVPGLEAGTDIPKATIRVGDCMIHGDLVVMHLTPGPGTRQTCGALLYPATEDDLLKLRSVIAGMEAAGQD